MKLKVQQSSYNQLFFRPRKGLRIIAVMRQTVEYCNRTRLRTPGAGWIAGLFLVLGVLSSTLSAVEPPIHGAWLGPEVAYKQGRGGTWYATWADDGYLYVTSDDTTGLSGNCSSKSRGPNSLAWVVNRFRGPKSPAWVAVNRLQGDDPAHLKGETVTCMDTYDDPPDPNNNLTSWKTSGIFSVDDKLYLVVEQDTYQDLANLFRETARNATILKSTDHGKTWSGSVADSIAHPMFPGTRFSTPSFIQYGRGGAGGLDGGETYAYAISNDGSWDNGDSIVLGRVRRSDLPRLRGQDWEFYSNGRWTHDLLEAQPVLREPNHLGMASSIYVPGLRKYILASWYYTDCTGYAAPGCGDHRTRWAWYEAPKPWGPWTKFWEPEWYPAGYFNPILVNKFLSPDGASGWVFYAGANDPYLYYHLIAAPFVLDLAPHSIINDSDTKAIAYQGRWTSARGGLGEFDADVHYTNDPTASATLRFQGTGVRVITDFTPYVNDPGTVEIYLDGRLQGTATAHNNDQLSQLSQRVLWSTLNLTPGEHTLELRKGGGAYLVVDAFVVLHE